MFTKGQSIEVRIEDAADGQKCFGKLPEGLGVFVTGPVAVGDRVRAEVFKIKKNYLEARLAEVLEPSAHRVTPECAHFGVCGGCKWQHVGYAEQLRIKRKIVADALVHVGGFESVEVAEALPSPRIFGYRNKLEFSFGERRYLLESEMGIEGGALAKPADFALGFHAPARYDKVVDIDLCHLATPEMNAALDLVRRFALERKLSVYSSDLQTGLLRNLVLRQGVQTGDFMVNLVTFEHVPGLMTELLGELRGALGERMTTFVNSVTRSRSMVAYGEEQVVLFGPGTIAERIGDCRFVISPNSFFQTNTLQAERLYELARTAAALTPADTVFDLYGGTGTIALYIARSCARVFGFELESSAVADAQKNADLNGVTNCRFVQTDLKHFGQALREMGEANHPDVVITDPPRAGMHPKAVDALRGVAPRRIVYVSCNPASLARDAKALCEGGLYALSRVQPVDLFPHTYHIESVAVLHRSAADR
jgi:23S rRNA (uracil1939-C5)-methyltransferase